MRAAVSGIPNPYVSLIVVRTGEGRIPVDAARDFGSIGGIELDAALAATSIAIATWNRSIARTTILTEP